MKLIDETAAPDPDDSTAQGLMAEIYLLTAQAGDSRPLTFEWTFTTLTGDERPLIGKGGDRISK